MCFRNGTKVVLKTEVNMLYCQSKVHTTGLTDIDPCAARLQDLVYDFKVPNDVFGGVYEKTSRNHIPLSCKSMCVSVCRQGYHARSPHSVHSPSLLSFSPYTSIKSPATMEKSAVGGKEDGRTSGILIGANCCSVSRILENE